MKKMILDRIPPQTLEAEVAVLRAMFFNSDAIQKVKKILSRSGEEFYKKSHQLIYQAMLRLLDKKKPVDLITLTDELQKEGRWEQVGGSAYLQELFLKSPILKDDGYTSSNVESHVQIVLEKYLLRRLIVIANAVVMRAYEDEDFEVILNKVRRLILELSCVVKAKNKSS